MSGPTSYHCPGCGTQIENWQPLQNPRCPECGEPLVEGRLQQASLGTTIVVMVLLAAGFLIYWAMK
jgi:DNA-directed RNA polymerase subunit RPC12/RpoP